MLNPQFIGRVALPIFAAVFPFMIIAGQLGLDVCRWWIVYGTATMVAALMGITTFSMRNSHGPGLAVSPVLGVLLDKPGGTHRGAGLLLRRVPRPVPGTWPNHRDRRVPRMAHRSRDSRRRGRECLAARVDRRKAKGKGPRGVTRGPFSCLRSSGSRCIRSRPTAPQHRCWNRSRGCSTDPRTTGSCTRQPAPLRSVAPRCCGSG